MTGKQWLMLRSESNTIKLHCSAFLLCEVMLCMLRLMRCIRRPYLDPKHLQRSTANAPLRLCCSKPQLVWEITVLWLAR